MNPEELARIEIDKLLNQCGWGVQDYTSLDLSASRVTICTIQRLYSMLRGEELDGDLEEHSTYEFGAADNWPKEVAYNPAIPIEEFKSKLRETGVTWSRCVLGVGG